MTWYDPASYTNVRPCQNLYCSAARPGPVSSKESELGERFAWVSLTVTNVTGTPGGSITGLSKAFTKFAERELSTRPPSANPARQDFIILVKLSGAVTHQVVPQRLDLSECIGRKTPFGYKINRFLTSTIGKID